MAKNTFKGKKILVAGGTGMIGAPLVEMLLDQGAWVRAVSLDDPKMAHPKTEFFKLNMTSTKNCRKACKNMDYVFNLLGAKASPAMAMAKPYSFMVPTLRYNIELMEAARLANVKGYLFTSSVGVYEPAEVLKEDNVSLPIWNTFPSPNDWYAGWAKRISELQGIAWLLEYGFKNIAIVRPANVYGPKDNFEGNNAMVIPSLIKRAIEASESGQPLTVWGDGSPIRDFIHARDVARGMLFAIEHGQGQALNLGSGKGYTIKQLAKTICRHIDPKLSIKWDKTKPSGDRKRLLDVTKAEALGFKPKINLNEGIKETVNWYLNNRKKMPKRYDIFNAH